MQRILAWLNSVLEYLNSPFLRQMPAFRNVSFTIRSFQSPHVQNLQVGACPFRAFKWGSIALSSVVIGNFFRFPGIFMPATRLRSSFAGLIPEWNRWMC